MSGYYEIFGDLPVDATRIDDTRSALCALLRRHLDSVHVAPRRADPRQATVRLSASGQVSSADAATVSADVAAFARTFSREAAQLDVTFVGQRQALVVGPDDRAITWFQIEALDQQIGVLERQRNVLLAQLEAAPLMDSGREDECVSDTVSCVP